MPLCEREGLATLAKVWRQGATGASAVRLATGYSWGEGVARFAGDAIVGLDIGAIPACLAMGADRAIGLGVWGRAMEKAVARAVWLRRNDCGEVEAARTG